jgi:hypothetical protein
MRETYLPAAQVLIGPTIDVVFEFRNRETRAEPSRQEASGLATTDVKAVSHCCEILE